MKRILIATDGSPSSAEATRFGLELAVEHGAEALFVHVVPARDVVPTMGAFGFPGALPHDVTEHDRVSLDEALAAARESGVAATTTLLQGDAVDEIVAYADSTDVDLIVIGSRGHGPVAGVLLGSVSQGVLRESKRPVLIVRGLAAAALAA
jgi:nucleotide-binding universal stress UspA family protein